VGQAPGHIIIEPGEQTAPAVALTESQARLEEGQVELAFLADPMLFAYGITAHVQGGSLEVRGFVPNEGVREQALRVATAQTGLHVIDRLRILPSLAGHGTVDKPENVCRAARVLLETDFPGHGQGMEVQCDPRGHLTVSGRVASFEDKVLVSRKLRQVPGCSCVINQLAVASADPVRKTQSAAPGETKPAPKWEPPGTPAPPPTVVTPAKKDKSSDLPSSGMPRISADPASPSPKRESAPLPVIETASPTTPAPKKAAVALPVIEAAPRPADQQSRQHAPPPVTAEKAPAPKQAPATQAIIDLPPLSAAPESRRPAPAPVEPEKGPAPKQAPAKVVTDVAPPPAATESRRPATATSLPPLVPPAAKPSAAKPTAGGSEESFVTQGMITFDEPPAAAKPPAPVKPPVSEKAPAPQKPATEITTPPAPVQLKPAPSTPAPAPLPPPPPVKPAPAPAERSSVPAATRPLDGTLRLDPPPLSPGKPQATKTPVPPSVAAPVRPAAPPDVRLKERIQAACGPAYEVQVTTVKGKSVLQLSITGRDEADGKRLMEQITPILKSPEFGTLEINAEVVYPAK
jgi:hypothetical protein